MGYYADLIKEKRNARDYDEINKLSKEIKQIVSELRRKYTHIRQTDDVNFLLDVLHDRGQQIPQSDKNKAEHAMQLDETRRRMSVAPRDWGNSKEEKENGKVFETWDDVVRGLEQQGYEVDSINRSRYSKWVTCYKGGDEYEVEFARLTYRDGETNYEMMGRISKVGPKRNEKEEKDNGRIEEMYREIQELKKKGLSSLDIDKYYGAINYRKTAEQYLAEYKKTKNTDYKYAAEGQLRKAEQLEREYKKHLHNSDEKGYYAKLAEEKVDKKNSKSWRIEFLGNSYYIAKPADVDLALGKARQVLYIKERQLDDEIRYAKESFAKFEKELSQIEKEVYQEFGK